MNINELLKTEGAFLEGKFTLNESGIRIPKGTHAAKLSFH